MGTPQSSEPDRLARQAEADHVMLPAWMGAAPLWQAAAVAAETLRPEKLAPSRIGEGEARGLAAASPRRRPPPPPRQRGSRTAALAKTSRTRGQILHLLLQHLPDLPAPERLAAARRYLAQPAHALDEAAQAALYDDVATVLGHPDLAALFGSGTRAEAPFAGVVGSVEINGLIDRLLIAPGHILFADYKTDRAPPEAAEDIPPPYLRQLAAYAAVLGTIYPCRTITALIVWTSAARVMPVPQPLLARHAPGTSQTSGIGSRP